MPQPEFVPISAEARYFRTSGRLPTDPPPGEPRNYDSFGALRGEFYAVTAVILDSIISDLTKKPLGKHFALKDYLQGFNKLHFYAQSGIKDTIDKVVRTLDKVHKGGRIRGYRPQPAVSAAYERLVTIFDMEGLPPDSHAEHTFAFVSGGAITAESFMNSFLVFLPEVYKRDRDQLGPGHNLPETPTFSLLTATARHSIPLLSELAMLRINTFLGLEGELATYKWLGAFYDARYFRLRRTGAGLMLELTPQAQDLLATFTQKYQNQLFSGCPAMVNFGEGSGVKRLWEWDITQAEPIYVRHFPDTH